MAYFVRLFFFLVKEYILLNDRSHSQMTAVQIDFIHFVISILYLIYNFLQVFLIGQNEGMVAKGVG